MVGVGQQCKSRTTLLDLGLNLGLFWTGIFCRGGRKEGRKEARRKEHSKEEARKGQKKEEGQRAKKGEVVRGKGGKPRKRKPQKARGIHKE